MKSYTDLEQSKKLAEFLPIESADMYWWSSGKRYYIEAIDDDDYDEDKDIRAWSLAALLDILPIKAYIEIDNVCCTLDITRNTLDTWFVSYYNRSYGCSLATCRNKELLDACYEMILKLHKLKML